MPNYTVRQGDCLSSIAYRHGLFWQKVWDHAKNAKIRGTRKDPNILLPGDVVFLPNKIQKEETGGTEQCHRFRKKGVPAYLRLQLLDEDDTPRAEVEYILTVDGSIYRGKTDTDGFIEEVPISPTAQRATIEVVNEEEDVCYHFSLGHIDPLDEVYGQQQRLCNLGFYNGPINGVYDEETKNAIRSFQKKFKLKETGQMDSLTLSKLEKLHGS